MDETRLLAEFVAGLSFDKLTHDVVSQAKTCFMDTLGVVLGGAKTETGKMIIGFTTSLRSIKESTILGTKEKTSPLYAALANGALAEILELDDGHRFSGEHQSSVVHPAVLAVGEPRNSSGKDLITAIVAGYEVMGRIGRAIHPSHLRKGYIPTGTCGGFGAAAAVSKLMNFGSEKIANALGIAGYFAPMSLDENYYGPSVKSFHAGQSTQTGMLAASLSEYGFTASPRTITQFSTTVSEEYDVTAITEGLGQEYEIMNIYFKPHAVCRFAHSAIDCVLEILKENIIDSNDIRDISVTTFTSYLSRYTDPTSNYIHCQFSLPYIVAVTIIAGEAGPKQFSLESVKDPAIHNLAKKVRVIVDDELVKIYPDKYPATVEITMNDGHKFYNRVDIPKGDPRNPLELSELRNKFRSLSSDSLNEEQIAKAIGMTLELEKIDDINELVQVLRG